jgi:transporter family protein
MSIFYAILSAFGFGITNSLLKIPTQKIGPIYSLLIRASIACAIFLPFALPLKFDFYWIFITLLLSLIGFFGLFFLFKAFEIGKVGLVSAVVNSNFVILIIFSSLFLGSSFQPVFILWILIILIGIFLFSLNLQDLKSPKGLNFAIITVIFFGIAFSFWKYPVNNIGAFQTAFWIEFGNIIFSLLYIFFTKTKVNFSVLNTRLKIYLLLSGITVAVGSVFQSLALQYGETNQVAPIFATSTLFSTLFAVIFFKERLNIKEIIGILLIVFGVAMLAVY